MKYSRPSSLDVSDATAVASDVLSPKTFYAGEDSEIKVGTITEATDLSAVDADLVTGNIKNGITIFGVAGHVDVRDVSDADALVGEVLLNKTFYAVGGAKKTGTLATQTLNPANENVLAGNYAATTLSAVDVDLITANIKNGITIFGVAGDPDVRDISDADAIAANVVLAKTFYAVSGARKTGTHECATPEVEIDVHETTKSAYSPTYVEDTYAMCEIDCAQDNHVTLATDTQTFDVTSMAFAVFAVFGTASYPSVRAFLFMGGVQMGSSGTFSSNAGEIELVKGVRELNGSQTVYGSIMSDEATTKQWQGYSRDDDDTKIAAVLHIGSMNAV